MWANHSTGHSLKNRAEITANSFSTTESRSVFALNVITSPPFADDVTYTKSCSLLHRAYFNWYLVTHWEYWFLPFVATLCIVLTAENSAWIHWLVSTCHEAHAPLPFASSTVVKRDLCVPWSASFLQTDEAVSDASGICSISASVLSQAEKKD